jgi:hypothetical protein
MAMNKKSPVRLIVTLLLASILAACGPQNMPASSPQTWIDAPIHGSTIPLAPYQIIAHAAFPAGISQFELAITGQGPVVLPVPADQAGQSLVYIQHAWTPPAPGTYLIQARAAGPDGAYGQMIEAQVHVGDEKSTGEPTKASNPTGTPTQGTCQVEAVVNLFCRAGPGSIYKDLDSFTPGQMAPIVGQSLDGQYWYVTGPNLGVTCTVPTGPAFVIVHGENCGVAPRFTPPPTPRPTEAPATEPPPQCNDDIDNDGDGRTDFVLGATGVGDRECTSATDNDEAVR